MFKDFTINFKGFFKTNIKIFFLIFLYFVILNSWFVSLSNDFKVNQIIDIENQYFYFTPYFSFLLHKILTSFFPSEIIGYLTIVVIPLFVLIFTYKIFYFFVPSKLSFLLALLTQSVYNNFNLRDVFFNINNIKKSVLKYCNKPLFQ